MKLLISAFILSGLISVVAFADDLSEARLELAAVQAKLEAERQRYNAAKSEMDRAELVARYLFPELRAREAALEKKISELEAKKKAEAEKQKNKTD